MSEVISLLERLRDLNVQSYPDLLPQKVSRPRAIPGRIPTLKKGHYIALSPMLHERFQFGGSWSNAGVGQAWLTPGQMESAWTSRALQKQLGIRRDHWDNSVLVRHPYEKLSLFGVDRVEFDETYLVWPEQNGQEPRIVMYSGHDERQFEHFVAFLRFLVGDAA